MYFQPPVYTNKLTAVVVILTPGYFRQSWTHQAPVLAKLNYGKQKKTFDVLNQVSAPILKA